MRLHLDVGGAPYVFRRLLAVASEGALAVFKLQVTLESTAAALAALQQPIPTEDPCSHAHSKRGNTSVDQGKVASAISTSRLQAASGAGIPASGQGPASAAGASVQQPGHITALAWIAFARSSGPGAASTAASGRNTSSATQGSAVAAAAASGDGQPMTDVAMDGTRTQQRRGSSTGSASTSEGGSRRSLTDSIRDSIRERQDAEADAILEQAQARAASSGSSGRGTGAIDAAAGSSSGVGILAEAGAGYSHTCLLAGTSDGWLQLHDSQGVLLLRQQLHASAVRSIRLRSWQMGECETIAQPCVEVIRKHLFMHVHPLPASHQDAAKNKLSRCSLYSK